MVRKSIKSGRDFKGIWIPKEIWLNPDISPIEKLLVCEIDSLDNDEETGCFASNEYFGNFFRMSEGAIANMVSSLKKRDIIFQVFFDGRNRGLRLHKNVKAGFTIEGISVHKNVKAGFTKRGKQVSRKNEHNNTENNTLNNTESERDAHSNSKPSKAEISKRDVAPTPSFPPGQLANATDEEVNELVDRSRRETKEIHAAFSKSKTANRTFEDAEKEIAEWAATDGIETVKHRYDLARRKFNEKDLPQLAAHFCSIYGVPGGSNREQLLKDPIEFFRVGLNKYLTNQNQFDRTANGQQSAPGGQNNQTRYSQTTRSQTTHFGGDADKFNQKPLF